MGGGTSRLRGGSSETVPTEAAGHDEPSRPSTASSLLSPHRQRVAAFQFGAPGDGGDLDAIGADTSTDRPMSGQGSAEKADQHSAHRTRAQSLWSRASSAVSTGLFSRTGSASSRKSGKATPGEKNGRDTPKATAVKPAAQTAESERQVAVEEQFCLELYVQGVFWQHEGDLEKAEENFAKAVAAAQQRLPADHAAHADYKRSFDFVQKMQGKGHQFEEARLLAEQAKEKEEAAAVAAAAAERIRREKEAVAWKRDPLARQRITDEGVKRRKALLAARARDKVRRAVVKIQAIRAFGGDPKHAIEVAHAKAREEEMARAAAGREGDGNSPASTSIAGRRVVRRVTSAKSFVRAISHAEGAEQQPAKTAQEEEEEHRQAAEQNLRDEEEARQHAQEVQALKQASAHAGLPVPPRLTALELKRRVDDSRARERQLASGSQHSGHFNALSAFQRAASGASTVGRLRRASSAGDKDSDFLGGKELLMPAELQDELTELEAKACSYDGQAMEASNRQGAKTDMCTRLRMSYDTQGPEYMATLEEEKKALQVEKTQRIALLDRALQVVDVSLGAHMVSRKRELEDERRRIVAELEERVAAAERDVKEWHMAMEAEIKQLEEEAHAEYVAVNRFTALADATRRQMDLVKRAKMAAEEREVNASETAEKQALVVQAEIRKHSLHCTAAMTFQTDRARLEREHRALEQAQAKALREKHIRQFGSVARAELERMRTEADEAQYDSTADGGSGEWNSAAPPGPKWTVSQCDLDAEEGGGGAEQGAGIERAMSVVFRKREGAESGIDVMKEEILLNEAELDSMANSSGLWTGPDKARPSGQHVHEEHEDVGPVSAEEARKIVEAERQRWRTMFPLGRVDATRTLANSATPRTTWSSGACVSGTVAVAVNGNELSLTSVSRPAVAGAHGQQSADIGLSTPGESLAELESTHVSLMSSWGAGRTVLDATSSIRGNISTLKGPEGVLCEDTDMLASADGRVQAAWLSDVYGRGCSFDAMRQDLGLFPTHSSEELQSAATLRLVEARGALDAMRKVAYAVMRGGEKLLAGAQELMRSGRGDINALSEARDTAGRAASLLRLAASVRVDGWYRAREAQRTAETVQHQADALLSDMVGAEAAAMVGVGGSRRVVAVGEAALVPGAVPQAHAKLELHMGERHGRFTSFLGLPLAVATLVRKLLAEQARRLKQGDSPLSDERLLADQKLVSALGYGAKKIDTVQLEKMRDEWHAEQKLEELIRGFLNGSLSREEYDVQVKAEGLTVVDEGEKFVNLPPSKISSAITLPATAGRGVAPAPAPVAGVGGQWANICGRWHFVPPRPAAGHTWKPSHFLQLAETDFDMLRRSSLYALVATPGFVDGFGRNKKLHRAIIVEDMEREKEAARISQGVPANLGAAHGGGLPVGARSDWQSAVAAPWKASGAVNCHDQRRDRPGCDAPQGVYDAFTDVLKDIATLPHGDHLNVMDKPRAAWNSASFALGTAGAGADDREHCSDATVKRGRGCERSQIVDEDVRRSMVYTLGETFRLLPSVATVPPQTASKTDKGSSVALDLSSLGMDDEYCFLLMHALGHHPVATVSGAEGKDQAWPVHEWLLPAPLQCSHVATGVHELRLAHNSIGNCGVLELSLALSGIPWSLWTTLKESTRGTADGEADFDGGDERGQEQGGMLRDLRTLDLRGNLVGDAGSTALADMLAVNRSLDSVSLADNQIAGAGVEALARALASNSSLTSLNLAHNLISGAQIRPLAAVMSWNEGLLRQLPCEGQSAPVNQTLRVLLLQGNSLGNEGVRLVAATLASHPALEDIVLDDNDIGDDGADVVGQALQLRRTEGLASLRHLSLARNVLSEGGMQCILVRLRAGQGGRVADEVDLSRNRAITSSEDQVAPFLDQIGIGRLVLLPSV